MANGVTEVIDELEVADRPPLAYRIASYWLPLLAGPPSYLLFRHRYGTPAVRRADQQGTDADPEHRPRRGNDC